MISDEQIITELRGKEHSLLKQLDKVRAALAAFTNEDQSTGFAYLEPVIEQPIKQFDQFLSYDQRVILALRNIHVGYIDNMVEALLKIGDETEKDKLYNGLTGAASRLYRKGILRADTRGKKYKYSFNDTAEAEKERAEILPFD